MSQDKVSLSGAALDFKSPALSNNFSILIKHCSISDPLHLHPRLIQFNGNILCAIVLNLSPSLIFSIILQFESHYFWSSYD
jgi:hypothetical protein